MDALEALFMAKKVQDAEQEITLAGFFELASREHEGLTLDEARKTLEELEELFQWIARKEPKPDGSAGEDGRAWELTDGGSAIEEGSSRRTIQDPPGSPSG